MQVVLYNTKNQRNYNSDITKMLMNTKHIEDHDNKWLTPFEWKGWERLRILWKSHLQNNNERSDQTYMGIRISLIISSTFMSLCEVLLMKLKKGSGKNWL